MHPSVVSRSSRVSGALGRPASGTLQKDERPCRVRVSAASLSSCSPWRAQRSELGCALEREKQYAAECQDATGDPVRNQHNGPPVPATRPRLALYEGKVSVRLSGFRREARAAQDSESVSIVSGRRKVESRAVWRCPMFQGRDEVRRRADIVAATWRTASGTADENIERPTSHTSARCLRPEYRNQQQAVPQATAADWSDMRRPVSPCIERIDGESGIRSVSRLPPSSGGRMESRRNGGLRRTLLATLRSNFGDSFSALTTRSAASAFLGLGGITLRRTGLLENRLELVSPGPSPSTNHDAPAANACSRASSHGNAVVTILTAGFPLSARRRTTSSPDTSGRPMSTMMMSNSVASARANPVLPSSAVLT